MGSANERLPLRGGAIMTGAQKATTAFWTFGFVAAVAWAGFWYSVGRGIADWICDSEVDLGDA